MSFASATLTCADGELVIGLLAFPHFEGPGDLQDGDLLTLENGDQCIARDVRHLAAGGYFWATLERVDD